MKHITKKFFPELKIHDDSAEPQTGDKLKEKPGKMRTETNSTQILPYGKTTGGSRVFSVAVLRSFRIFRWF